MNSLTRFLRRISSRLLLSPARLEAIEALDPSHIYVENVRSLFGISTSLAKRLCELAVRQGFLEKRIQVLCPDQTVADEAPTEEQLPAEVSCWEDVQGSYRETTYQTSRLKKLEFYVFKERAA